MGTNSLQASKKRSFHLPSFIRRSSAGERQEPATNAEEIARTAEEVAHVQKAAAWQWYTRGVGEAAVPTTRPPVPNSQAPSDAENNGVKGISKGGESIISESPRAASRFKAEASFTRPTSSATLPTSSATLPTPSAPPSGGPSTPLYDDVELSGLRTQMADFVQRLQNQHSIKDNEQFPAVGDHQKSKPPPACPSAPSASIDHQQTKPPPVAATSSSDHLLTTLPPAPVASTVPLHMRPFSALHKFFRKMVTGSIAKSTNNFPQLIDSPTVVQDPEVLIPEDQNEDTTQHHYHHYIHHHHHHYHYAESPEEQAPVIRSRRRHSENSGIRPPIPSPWEAESDEEEDEAEENLIEAYLARRRRHSDSFAGQLQRKKADFHEDEGMKEESVKAAISPMRQFSRRYSSERFSPKKIPNLVAAERKDGSSDEFLASRRTRHSAEYYWEEASVERMTEGGGKSAGAPGGGKSAGGAYKLGGAAGGGTQATPRRRHSTGGSRMPAEAAQLEMGKRSPSARYYLDVLDAIPAPANATPTHRAGLPPLYPQKPVGLVH